MPRPKPRIRRSPDGWTVARPGYGFTTAATAGPYATFQAAIDSLQPKTASAGQCTHTTYTPSASDFRRRGHLFWPLEVR